MTARPGAVVLQAGPLFAVAAPVQDARPQLARRGLLKSDHLAFSIGRGGRRRGSRGVVRFVVGSIFRGYFVANLTGSRFVWVKKSPRGFRERCTLVENLMATKMACLRSLGFWRRSRCRHCNFETEKLEATPKNLSISNHLFRKRSTKSTSIKFSFKIRRLMIDD